MRIGVIAFCTFILVSSMAAAPSVDKIVIEVPGELEPREYATLAVHGLLPSDLPQAQVSCQPNEGVVLIPAQAWGGSPFLLFAAKNPGEYTVTVALNEWLTHLQMTIDEAKRIGVSADHVAEIAALQKKLEGIYPAKYGTAVVKVQSAGPPLELSLTLPQTLREGEEGTGTAATNKPATVALSSDTGRLKVPAAVASPPGNFPVAAVQNELEDGDITATVLASAEDKTARGAVSVMDDDGGPPPGSRSVTVVYESADNTPQFVLATRLVEQYCDGKKHVWRFVDDDMKEPDGKTPVWLEEYNQVIKQQGTPLPALVVEADWNGKKVVQIRAFPKLDQGPIPAADQAIALIKEAGG